MSNSDGVWEKRLKKNILERNILAIAFVLYMDQARGGVMLFLVPSQRETETGRDWEL